MPALYLVATPIGNLEDISLRALRILKEVDLILCEDTRITRKLLDHYRVKKPLVSYHQHSKLKKLKYILAELQKNKSLALVSDAGTPTVSDPGTSLIDYLLDNIPDLEIIPIPGPSALIAALSISGFSANKFVFLGFPPAKKKRKKFFQEAADSKHTVVLYESPHRIVKTLKELKLSLPYKSPAVVCRELTKKFEIVYRGLIQRIIDKLERTKIRGEFVVIIPGPKLRRGAHGDNKRCLKKS